MNEPIMKPLIHPPCFPDEFPTGYLVRLAELNKYSSAIWLVHDDHRQRNIRTAHYFYRLLEQLDWTGYKKNNYKNLIKVKSQYFDMKRIKFCPLCLKENPYIRTIWQLRPTQVCRQHKIWLRDSCIACQKPTTVASSKLIECQCGHPISDQELLIASPDMLKMQAFIEGDHFINLEMSKKLEERLDLVLFFNRWIKYRGTIQGLHNCEDARNTLEDAAEALFAGRVGFINFLKRLYSVGTQISHFERFHHEFYRKYNTEFFSEFRSMIEEFINQNWEKPLTRRNSNFSEETIQQHPWIPLAAACREYDLPKSKLNKAFINGYIRYKKEIKEKRTLTYLYKPDIEDRFFRIRDIITLKEARLILGLTKSQFSQMVEAGSFKLAISPKESGMGTWCFSFDEINIIKNKLINKLNDSGGETWSFSRIMKSFGGKSENFLVKFVDAIKLERVKPASFDRKRSGYSSLNFSKQEFISWFELEKIDQELMSIPIFAKVLGINQQFAYELVRYGYIEAFERDGKAGVWINKDALTNFREKYVLLSKLSKAINIQSKTLISYLASRDVYPLDINEINKLRQKIYLKEHMKNIQIIANYFREQRS